jgi:hypothetical protein
MWNVVQLLGQFPDNFFPAQRQNDPPQPREDWFEEA